MSGSFFDDTNVTPLPKVLNHWKGVQESSPAFSVISCFSVV